ncbi:kelch-like protein 10 [Eucyclogobius newberryi]|uniref:kelch-like protein 10 n=1 Tax=Eucyclogobius newberryi TaxID=166745 RepID=UPI003B5CF01B
MGSPMSVFEEMRREKMLCDASLNVAGTQFLAHKLVLCSCSLYFRALFSQWSSPDCRDFDIPLVSANIMKNILHFAYTGVVHVTDENIQELFLAADFFDISGISQACCQFMVKSLSPRSCITTWWLTKTYYYPQLRKPAFVYILKHFEEVVASSEEFLSLSKEELCSIFEEDQLNVKQERIVFEAFIKWVKHDLREREKYLAYLLSKIRLAHVDLIYFDQTIRDNPLFKGNNACKKLVNKSRNLILNARFSSQSAYLARPRLPCAVLMAIGGWSGSTPTNCIEAYDNRANRWVVVANHDKTPRAFHGTVFLNGSVYLIGGFDGTSIFCTTHKFDLVNHTWQEVAPMHVQRCYVSVALLDMFIYAMGGFNGVARENTAEKYSPEANQWTMIAPMLEKRSDASSTVHNGYIYICGGFNATHYLSTAECYNPLTNQWTMIAEMSSKRTGVSVIAYANEIYAVGGYNGQNRLKEVEAYNPRTRKWRSLPSMRKRRSNFGIEVVEGRLYVVGGFNGRTTIRHVESFDTTTQEWTEVPHMPICRSALSCCVAYDLPNMRDYAATQEDGE